jgi:hypothetical protein
MPDWRKLVGEHLAALALDPQEREEVIEELAAHFEETFVDLRKRGLTEENATSRCLDEVRDWNSLRRSLQAARRKENVMSYRVKELWLPGLLTFTLPMCLLSLTQSRPVVTRERFFILNGTVEIGRVFGHKPWVLSWGHPPMAVVFIPWLLALPLVGAIGAFLSHRAGGSRRAIFFSIIFPVVPFLATILLITPVILAFDHFIAHNPVPASIPVAVLGLVFLPGVALLAGGFPVQLFFSRRLPSRGLTSN